METWEMWLAWAGLTAVLLGMVWAANRVLDAIERRMRR